MLKKTCTTQLIFIFSTCYKLLFSSNGKNQLLLWIISYLLHPCPPVVSVVMAKPHVVFHIVYSVPQWAAATPAPRGPRAATVVASSERSQFLLLLLIILIGFLLIVGIVVREVPVIKAWAPGLSWLTCLCLRLMAPPPPEKDPAGPFRSYVSVVPLLVCRYGNSSKRSS